MDFTLTRPSISETLSPDQGVQAWVTKQLEIAGQRVAERDAKLLERDNDLRLSKLKIEALMLELAHLRCMRFGASSEAIASVHGDLFDETAGADIAALEAEINAARPVDSSATTVAGSVLTQAKRMGAGRQALSAHLPRIVHRHD